MVAWQGDPQEFGRRVQTEARRRGLATAQDVFVVADGGVWIWNVQQDRFGQAKGMLDFYHASEHLWAVACSLYPADETAAQAWVEPLLSRLTHREETGVLQTLDDLPVWCAAQKREVPPGGGTRTSVFSEPSGTYPLCSDGGPRLSQWQWSHGIVLFAVARPL